MKVNENKSMQNENIKNQENRNSLIKNIKNMIEYFEIYYELIDGNPISKHKMSILFFDIVLNYYKTSCILIDYSSNLSNKFKNRIMKDITQQQCSAKLFDLVDFMFKIIKKILIKIDEKTTYDNIHILFYITFYSVFPEDLKHTLSKELNLTYLENNIIQKCNSNKNDLRVFNFNPSKFNFISNDQRKFLQNFTESKNMNINIKMLNNYQDIITLYKIIVNMRNFDK